MVGESRGAVKCRIPWNTFSDISPDLRKKTNTKNLIGKHMDFASKLDDGRVPKDPLEEVRRLEDWVGGRVKDPRVGPWKPVILRTGI